MQKLLFYTRNLSIWGFWYSAGGTGTKPPKMSRDNCISIKGKKHAITRMSLISIMLSKRSKNKQNYTIFLGRHIYRWENYKEQRNDYHKGQNSGFHWVGIKALIRENDVREGSRVLWFCSVLFLAGWWLHGFWFTIII